MKTLIPYQHKSFQGLIEQSCFNMLFCEHSKEGLTAFVEHPYSLSTEAGPSPTSSLSGYYPGRT